MRWLVGLPVRRGTKSLVGLGSLLGDASIQPACHGLLSNALDHADDGNMYSGAATRSSWVVMRQMLLADVVPGRAAILVTRLTLGRTKATARLSPHVSVQIRHPLFGMTMAMFETL